MQVQFSEWQRSSIEPVQVQFSEWRRSSIEPMQVQHHQQALPERFPDAVDDDRRVLVRWHPMGK